MGLKRALSLAEAERIAFNNYEPPDGDDEGPTEEDYEPDWDDDTPKVYWKINYRRS